MATITKELEIEIDDDDLTNLLEDLSDGEKQDLINDLSSDLKNEDFKETLVGMLSSIDRHKIVDVFVKMLEAVDNRELERSLWEHLMPLVQPPSYDQDVVCVHTHHDVDAGCDETHLFATRAAADKWLVENDYRHFIADEGAGPIDRWRKPVYRGWTELGVGTTDVDLDTEWETAEVFGTRVAR